VTAHADTLARSVIALRILWDRGVLVRVDSPPGTAVHRRTEEED
jgi:hypothetical protein